MRLRLLIALALIIVLVFGTGLFAAASDDEPNCWWFSYTLSITGKKVLTVPNSCIPCMGFCDLLPPPPGLGAKHGNGFVAVGR